MMRIIEKEEIINNKKTIIKEKNKREEE